VLHVTYRENPRLIGLATTHTMENMSIESEPEVTDFFEWFKHSSIILLINTILMGKSMGIIKEIDG